MAFPTVAASGSGISDTGASTTHTVTLPTVVASGDLLLLFFANDGTATASVTTPASGWTELSTAIQTSSNRLTILYRVADGGEASTITVTTSVAEASAHTIYRITGHNSVLEASTAVAETTGSPDAGSLNPAGWDVEDTLWFVAYGWDGNVSHSAYPTGWDSNQLTNRYISGGGTGVASASKTNAAASEDPGAGALSAADGTVSYTVAIQPSAGGGGGGLSIPVAMHHYSQMRGN